MKVAVMLYGARVSPRFNYSQRALIVEMDGRQEIYRRKMPVQGCAPEQITELLLKEGVELVICGGINHCFQEFFKERGIAVIWGIIGDLEHVLTAFQANQLVAGMGCCPQRSRTGRQFRNGGPKGSRETKDDTAPK
jgi:predicted Fe-Mo cluster-binding NifX family protein